MNSVPFNDLTRSWLTGNDVSETVRAIISSGWYVLGPNVAAFEQELADFLGVGHAVGVASGTDALVLALQAVGCERDDRVATVANAGGYASTAALQIGCIPTFVDIDPRTLLMSPESLDAVLASVPVKAVVVTHLYGNIVPEEVFTVCRRHDVKVVEDCAQAIGAQRSARAGSFGDAAAFSFYPTKNLGGIGDGGAVVSNQADVAAVVRELRQYGWADKYSVVRAGGRNSRLDEAQAGVLRLGLPRVDGFNERRRQVVARYAEALLHGDSLMATGTGQDSAAHLAVVVAPDSAARERIQTHLRGDGIDTAVHYPIPDHHQAGIVGEQPCPLPATEDIIERIVTVPCFPELTDGEVDRVCAALSSFTG